jgi:putative oxygen-independent coproporphyrinogen III oxidase
MNLYSIYLHIPFCSHRCAYCDFNTYAGLESLIPQYVGALCREIESVAATIENKLLVHTVFFGGGTPSLLPLDEIERILTTLAKSFTLTSNVEITLEANPGTLSQTYLSGLHHLGVNRLSLGVQSANPAELGFLERQHDYIDVIHSATWARQAGFDNLNMDMIFGLPYQSLENWQHSLELVLGLQPEHFSLYALTLEHGTPLEHWTRRGLVDAPDSDLAADMYEWAGERLSTAGYSQYEISNWARRRGKKLLSCRHNLQYWRGLPYLGFGAGAHGYAAHQRTANVLSPAAYIQRCLPENQGKSELGNFPRSPATQILTPLDRKTEIGEYMMMGLRLVEDGISAADFEARFSEPLELAFSSQIESLVKKGLLEWAGTNSSRLRLTPGGRLLGNQVFMEFI